LFKNKKYYSKPGGTVLKDSDEVFDKVYVEENTFTDCKIGGNYVGEVVVESVLDGKRRIMKSEDLAMEIPNVETQGSRKYLYIIGRKNRYPARIADMNFDLVEKSLKDSLLIRDCFMTKTIDKDHKDCYMLYVEPREEIFDVLNINLEELKSAVELLIKELKDKSVNVVAYAIMRFDGMRNVAGKLQYYTIT